jgi:hypothetical protein
VARTVVACAFIAALFIAGAGCGEEPDADDLLTLVAIESISDESLGPGDTEVAADVELTFRDWFNGGVVVEARVSSSLTPEQMTALLTGGAESRAQAWEQVMAASFPAGMAERLEVGYRGLIRNHILTVPLTIPSADTAGNPFTSAFVVAYLADIEEIEIDGQEDSLVVTPYGREAGILNDVVLVGLEGAP